MAQRNDNLILIAAVIFTAVFAIALAPTAQAATIAQWSFEANDFLADSSGNGNTLANNGATAVEDPHAGAPGTGVASFDGVNDWMRTAANLDLSPYSQIRVSWWQKVAAASAGIVWEHSPSFVGEPGAIIADVNDGGNASRGKIGVWGANPAVSGANINLDQYVNAYNSTWEHVAVEIDLDATNGADVVKLFLNGSPTGIPTTAQTANLTSFLDDVLYLGTRGGTGTYLTGSIDELVIQSIPEPGTIALLFAAAMPLLLLRRRNG